MLKPLAAVLYAISTHKPSECATLVRHIIFMEYILHKYNRGHMRPNFPDKLSRFCSG